MTARADILLLGAMEPAHEALLDERFTVHRDRQTDLETILAAHGSDITGIITRGRVPVNGALMDRLPRLEIVANFGVGYDSVDAAAAAVRGVIVTNTPDVLNDEMADFTVGLLLATIRRIPQADRYIREGHWPARGAFPLGPSLRDRRIGIVGMGRIAAIITKRLAAFDVPIAYHSRTRRPALDYPYYAELRALASDVDVLIVVLPGHHTTRNIINADVLADLGPNGILINVARGSVVDEAALIEALRSGAIMAAGLDVFAQEPDVPEALRAMDQVVLVPHIGTATHHTRGLMGKLVIDNILSWFDGRGAITPVPETPNPGPAMLFNPGV
jgi:lactate dehydrogenase-like 2-hydroxyacid dehydrogenase